jgi:hypothetical protein
MARTALALLLGFVSMVATVMLIQTLGHALYPPPEIDFKDSAAVAALISTMPVSALLIVVLSWSSGAFVGAAVAARVDRERGTGCAIGMGVLMVLLVGINLLMIPHPLWMSALGLLLPLPMAVLAGRLVR